MIAIILYYIIFGLVLVIYEVQVCPFLECSGYFEAFKNTFGPIVLLLPLRVYLFNWHQQKISDFGSAKKPALFSLPWREFITDLVGWLLIGLGIGFVFVFYSHVPVITVLKLILGCLAFGLFGGMLCFLSMERRIIEFLKTEKSEVSFTPQRMFSVSRKMLFFTITVLLFMVMAILLMAFMNVNYLLEHKASLGIDFFVSFFKEILFAFFILSVLSLFILARYSQNLKANLSIQLGVMEDITQGNFNTQVPVVTNDEFGIIAAKTNEMIKGLKEGDFCQISFGRFVTPEVSDRILKGQVPVEGELRNVTIMLCDLRGYTTFVERREPREVVSFLNEYFAVMEQAVKQYGGIVLQFIGDEIEAVFGAPIELPDHPEKAVLAAVEMRARLKDLNNQRVSLNKAPVAHGIGIHTGNVLAGSIGSEDRMVYSMVGDTVNTASRLESLNKTFGTDILVSQKTKELVRRMDLNFASLGKAALKGKSEEIEIFKVL
jgi:class 3 adenylate cyclase